MRKILVLGMSPLPFENEKKVYGTGIRTWQFILPMLEKGYEICLTSYAVPSAYDNNFKSILNEKRSYKGYEFTCNVLSKKDFENVTFLSEIFMNFNPGCIIGCTFYPSYIASRILNNLKKEQQVPYWADLFGHVMAEAQARAFMDDSDECLFHYWNSEFNILTKADIFSCVSQRQSYALIGELGATGRLNKWTSGYDFSKVIPCGMPDEDFIHKKNVLKGLGSIEDDDFVVLWSGGYNTWTDVETLYKGLASAMEKNPKIKFVSTGGEIPEQDVKTYPYFLKLIGSGKHDDNFFMNGWINGSDVPNYYFEADIGINIDKDIYEVRLGSKNRILDWMRAGLCVLSSNVCELTEIMKRERIGFTFKAHDFNDLSNVLLYLSHNKEEVKKTGQRGKNYAKECFNFNKTTECVMEWLKSPEFAPDKFKDNLLFFEKEEALKNCNLIVENQKEMISKKDERIKNLEDMVSKNFIHKTYGYFKALKGKVKKSGSIY